jgi:hypothetical protein
MLLPFHSLLRFGPRDSTRGWVLACVLLAACSTPLPPYTPRTPAPAQPLSTPPATPVPPAIPAAERGMGKPGMAEVSQPASATDVVIQAKPLYADAVAARFPEPPVKYRTPAFNAGRSALTSNAELAAWMRALLRDGRATPAGNTVRLLSVGTSQGGVPIEALLFTRNAQATAASLLQAGRPTVLLLGQQRGDEPAGAEALLSIAEELALWPLGKLLEHINIVLLPRANPDGAALGSALTTSGIDLNRDHLLLRTPEAQAVAQLAREFRPVVVIDLHEYSAIEPYLAKFGALQRFDALVQYATVANLPELVTKAAEEWFRRPMVASLAAQDLSVEWLYTTSAQAADMTMSMGSVDPDNARNASGLRNAISFAIETRGVGLGRLHLARRVHTHAVAIRSMLEGAAQHAADLNQLRRFVDAEVASLACQGQAIVSASPTPSEYTLTMLDPVTGADRKLTVAWDSALMLEARKSRPRPCGFWLSEAQGDAALRLRALGVLVQQIQQNGVVRGEVYQEVVREPGTRAQPAAGADTALRVEVQSAPALIDASAGSYYVPLDQPLANLALAALEPDSPDSYVAHRVVDALSGIARVMARPSWRMTALP